MLTTVINEVVINPLGAGSGGYIELLSDPGGSLDGLSLLIVDGNVGSEGVVQNAIELDNVALGTNGLLMITGLTTTGEFFVVGPTGALIRTDLVLADQSLSLLLVEGTAPTTGEDVDPDDDGQLDLPDGSTLVDAVGQLDGDPSDLVYGGVALSLDGPGVPDAASRRFDAAEPLSTDSWFFGDLASDQVGVVEFDPDRLGGNAPGNAQLTPSTPNRRVGVDAAGNLFIQGDSGPNTIVVVPAGDAPDAVSVTFDGSPFGVFSGVESVNMQTYGGDDRLDVSPELVPNVFLVGAAGADTLTGGSSDDILIGGSGDDEIVGNAGVDFIQAGAGSDLVEGNAGADQITGGEGDDTIQANQGNDLLFGEGGNDRIEAGQGFDSIDAGTGDDLVFGGNGSDFVIGGTGDDTLIGQVGLDTLAGGPGNDLLRGSSGLDQLVGDQGDDTLEGNDGRDLLVGGEGNDLLLGGRNFDELFGLGGDDTLNGHQGTDSLDGGLGADQFEIRRNSESSLERIFRNNQGQIVLRRFRVVGGEEFIEEQEQIVGFDEFDTLFYFAGGGDDTINMADDVMLFGTIDGGPGFDTALIPTALSDNWILLNIESEDDE